METMGKMSHVMKVSSNGQVSIPAEARARWNTKEVIVLDMGDYILMKPNPADPINSLMGKYAAPGPDSAAIRKREREDDARRERRRSR